MMDTFLAVISIVSFLLAIVSMYKTKREREQAATAATVIAQRIDSAAMSLKGVFTAVNSIVQMPKTRSVGVKDLQDAARVARSQVLVSAEILKEADDLTALWRSGDAHEAVHGSGGWKSDPPPAPVPTPVEGPPDQ